MFLDFDNGSVPINECKIGVVVQDAVQENKWGHIVGFGTIYNELCIEVRWSFPAGSTSYETPRDLVIYR